MAALSSSSPEHVTEPLVTSSTVTPGNPAKAAFILPPQPDGHVMPVTLKLTVLEVNCVAAAGVDDVVVSLLGCCAQPNANSTMHAANSLSFIVIPLE